MRFVACLGLALLLSGCGILGSDKPLGPSTGAFQSGDCHALAEEHAAEAAWIDLDTDSQKRVFTVAYDECQQWRSDHVWHAP